MNLFHTVSRHREHRVAACGHLIRACECCAHCLRCIIAEGKSWVFSTILKQNIRVWSGEQTCDQVQECFVCEGQGSEQC